jgi:hypothetical protein
MFCFNFCNFFSQHGFFHNRFSRNFRFGILKYAPAHEVSLMVARAERKIGSGLYFAPLGSLRRNFFPKSAPGPAPNLEEELSSTK